MRTIQIGGLLAAGVVLVGLVLAPAASADESPSPNSGCGAALLALTSAEKAASDATAADKAAADAKSADDALADATAAVNTTRAAALAGGVTTAELADNAATARARKVVLLAIANPTQAEKDELTTINAKLALVDAFNAATAKADAAKVVADKTDADALRREADKTDVAVLAEAVKKASAAADKACGSGSVHFENCDQVRLADKAPLRFDQPGYRVGLDFDRDGLACEAVEGVRTVDPPRTPRRLPAAVDTGHAA